MRRLLLLTLLALAIGLTGLAAAPATALACEESAQPLADELRDAPLVFRGEVTAVHEVTERQVAYDVKVSRVYRGDAVEKKTTVYAPATTGRCGLAGVSKDERWMFLASETDGMVSTHSYDGTREVSERVLRKVERDLGRGEKPASAPEEEPPATATLERVADDAAEEFWPMSLPGFVLVGVGLVVLAAARGLGRRAERREH